MNEKPRKIIHFDMDCFFVAVEERDNPGLRGKAVAVGGQPGRRGIIATCNYEARRFGVKSAMPSSYAKQICPDLIIVDGHMNVYKEVSDEMISIFEEFSDEIEPLSLDEAYLDVSSSTHFKGSATLIAQDIRKKIFAKTGLTASAGVSVNKLIAKIASDINKPNGIFVVPPHQVSSFISALPVKLLYGVGKAKLVQLSEMKITHCSDLQKIALPDLIKNFGKFGFSLYNFCRGIDDRIVDPIRTPKAFSIEKTYEADISEISILEKHAKKLLEEFKERLCVPRELEIKSVFIKLKFSDFRQITAQEKASSVDITTIYNLLRRSFIREKKPVRLIGIGVYLNDKFFMQNKPVQLSFDFISLPRR